MLILAFADGKLQGTCVDPEGRRTSFTLEGEQILASYTDIYGYTSIIVDAVILFDGLLPEQFWHLTFGWRGTEVIVNPRGDARRGGFWMDFPEPEWRLTDAEYEALPKRERAALEVKQQATAYSGLRSSFNFHGHQPLKIRVSDVTGPVADLTVATPAP